MKVLLCIRQDYYKSFAADSMLVLKIAKYLKKMGVSVDINNGGIIDYSSYDIVHLFNLNIMGETYKYYKLASHDKCKIVISPMYWNMKKYYEYKKDDESLKLWDRCKTYREEVLRKSKVIYCNSELEKASLQKDFKFTTKTQVIYNGIEVENEDIPLYNFRERYNLNNYVLCVGEICNKKNQLTICKVCDKLGIQLVLIGDVSDKEYFKECMKYKNVLYLGFMDSYNVYNAYRFAKLHVLPSFVALPGLSSLEAAASGCNIISSDEGCAKEYFKDMALYFNPYDEESIMNAINKGLKQRKNSELKNYVKENYDWEKTVKSLYESYNSIM